MFRITGEQGFHIDFENGYTVSVQWGPRNYCSNRSRTLGAVEEPAKDSRTAEVAVFVGDKFLSVEDLVGMDYAYQGPKNVAEILAKVAALPPVK